MPRYGSAHARLFHLAAGFVALGHRTVLITSDANHSACYPKTAKVYNREELDGVEICWIRTKKYVKTASIARVLSWLDFERRLFGMKLDTFPKPDVVLVSSLSIFTVLYGLYLKRRFGVPLAFEVRDIWPLTMTEEGGFSKWHPLALLMGMVEKTGYRNADLIVGTMPKLDLHVHNVLGYKRPFFCAPLGFDPQNGTDASGVEHRFTHDFPKNKIIIGYAGSMGITNALHSFIGAIKLLQEHTNLHFMLVGGGDLRSQFEEELRDCHNVTFLPKIQQTEIDAFLRQCDIVYLSTKESRVWDYGQSMNKVVEYMRAGRPILANYSGHPSMINEAQCGRFLRGATAEQVKEAILSFIALGQEELRRMGERGKSWVNQRRSYPVLARAYAERLAALREEYISHCRQHSPIRQIRQRQTRV